MKTFADIYKWMENDPVYISEGIVLNFTEMVAKEMKKQNISTKELAKRLGKSESFVRRFMAGECVFTIEKMVKIALAIGKKLEVKIV